MPREDSPLVLGSRSPRRSEILESLGIRFVVRAREVDESTLPGESPDAYVARVAHLKLGAIRAALSEDKQEYAGVLVADTTVTIGGQILGKPRDEDESLRMITALSGNTHRVLTAYGLYHRPTGREISRIVATEVSMRAASEQELRGYVATGEGMDKAGAYAIQGKASFLVERIAGSYSNVVGLPICELILDLRELKLLGNYP